MRAGQIPQHAALNNQPQPLIGFSEISPEKG